MSGRAEPGHHAGRGVLLARAALVASVVLILGATLGPFSAIDPGQIPPRWCLACGGAWLTDGISNVVLFVPLGLALAASGVPAWRAIGAGTLLSLLVETLQSVGIPPARSPASADVLANAWGAVCGVLLWRARYALLTPSPVLARRLAVGWSSGAAAVCAASALLLQPPDDATTSPVTITPSRYDYAPGFGWYDGVLQGATVNGTAVGHRGSGPVVVQTSAVPRTFALQATLTGRDTARYGRVVLFVHLPGDTTAVAMLVQRDARAELMVRRRASMWGLAMPPVVLWSAFAERAADDPRPLTLTAHADGRALTLSSASAAARDSVTLRLTPLLGWSLIQTIARPIGPYGTLWLVAWLLLLAAPAGFYAARGAVAGRHRGAGSLAASRAARGVLTILPLPVSLGVLPPLLDVAPLVPQEWVWLVLLLAGGFAAGTATRGARGVSFPT
ncbi:MAG: VanZ family protein [Gemmatimonadetes bacterium]|nr:VanZ family protein [Gemmatimonadota bacterium]